MNKLRDLVEASSGVADPRVLAAIAEALGQQVAHRKWRVLADPAPEPS